MSNVGGCCSYRWLLAMTARGGRVACTGVCNGPKVRYRCSGAELAVHASHGAVEVIYCTSTFYGLHLSPSAEGNLDQKAKSLTDDLSKPYTYSFKHHQQ